MSAALPLRILVVDDSRDDRQWIVSLLVEDDSRRCVVEEAATIEEAVALVTASPFDLLIVDWELPDGTGLELSRHPRVTSHRLPLIIITGNERPNQGRDAVGEGAADFLPKAEITARTLARTCVHALMRSGFERELDAVRRAEAEAGRREREARVAAELALVEEQKARKRVTGLHALAVELASATTTAEIAAVVVAHAAVFEGATAVGVYVLRNETLHLEGAWGFSADVRAAWSTLPLSVSTPLTDALRSGGPIRVENAAELKQLVPSLREPAAGSWLVVPMGSSKGANGVLGLRFLEGEVPARDGLSYIELVAEHVGQTLVRAQLYADARLAAEFEERLLAVLGHDLRTPLSAIMLTAHLLKEADPASTLIARLERSGQRMADLVTDILDRAAIRRGQTPATQQGALDLGAVLRDQIEELRMALPKTVIQLDARGLVETPCEPSRTSQIVSNLVRNAAQHGTPGGSVTVHAESKAGNSRITVHNVGPMIPEIDLPRLFDPFSRGSRAPKGGTGLGLFIVHETVAAMGGEVTVASDDSGTSFTVVLPQHVPELGSSSSRREGGHS